MNKHCSLSLISKDLLLFTLHVKRNGIKPFYFCQSQLFHSTGTTDVPTGTVWPTAVTAGHAPADTTSGDPPAVTTAAPPPPPATPVADVSSQQPPMSSAEFTLSQTTPPAPTTPTTSSTTTGAHSGSAGPDPTTGAATTVRGGCGTLSCSQLLLPVISLLLSQTQILIFNNWEFLRRLKLRLFYSCWRCYEELFSSRSEAPS